MMFRSDVFGGVPAGMQSGCTTDCDANMDEGKDIETFKKEVQSDLEKRKVRYGDKNRRWYYSNKDCAEGYYFQPAGKSSRCIRNELKPAPPQVNNIPLPPNVIKPIQVIAPQQIVVASDQPPNPPSMPPTMPPTDEDPPAHTTTDAGVDTAARVLADQAVVVANKAATEARKGGFGSLLVLSAIGYGIYKLLK